MDPLKRHLAVVRRHNKALDCFSSDFRVPIRLVSGELSHVTRDGGTALDGSSTFTLPAGAVPLECWEPAHAPWLLGECIKLGHDPDTGPSHPCPHCLQVRGSNGQTLWLWVDGDMIGTAQLRKRRP